MKKYTTMFLLVFLIVPTIAGAENVEGKAHAVSWGENARSANGEDNNEDTPANNHNTSRSNKRIPIVGDTTGGDDANEEKSMQTTDLIVKSEGAAEEEEKKKKDRDISIPRQALQRSAVATTKDKGDNKGDEKANNHNTSRSNKRHPGVVDADIAIELTTSELTERFTDLEDDVEVVLPKGLMVKKGGGDAMVITKIKKEGTTKKAMGTMQKSLFGFISMAVPIEVEVSDDGAITDIKKPWYSFLLW